MKKKIRRTLQLVILLQLLLAVTLNAQEAKQERAKELSGLQTRIDGVLYSGLEYWDASDPPANLRNQNSGFTITRAYLNFRGDAKNPLYRGWGYRFTLDFSPAANVGDGCEQDTSSSSQAQAAPAQGSCQISNDLNAYFKYAYFFLPLGNQTEGKHQLVIGQQETPFAADLQKTWGTRHVARSVLRQARAADSADRGIGLKSSTKNFKAHLLLGNGEGYHRNNAEPGASNASQALDLYGNLTFFGSRESQTHSLYLHLPFRLYNIIGLKDREKDAGELNEGRDLGRLRGFGIGYEFIYAFQSADGKNEFKFAFGDYYLNRPGGHDGPENLDTIVGEARGSIDYYWLTFQSGIFGGFLSYYQATSTNADGRLVALREGTSGRVIRRVYGLNFRPNINIAFLDISLGEDSIHLDSPDPNIGTSKRGNTFLRFGLTFELYNSGSGL